MSHTGPKACLHCEAAYEGHNLYCLGCGYKWCPRCKECLPSEAFGKNASTASGLANYCRACYVPLRAADRERQHAYNVAYYAANQEEERARAAAYKEAHRKEMRAYQNVYNHSSAGLLTQIRHNIKRRREALDV